MSDYDNDFNRKSMRGRDSNGEPNPIDIHVGARVRLRRTLLGLSQEKLGELIGLTFQQIQKYERGLNRIGASRLWDISKVLDTPIAYFFEEMPDGFAEKSPRMISGAPVSETETPFDFDPMQKRETLDLVRTYYRIKNPAVAHKVYELMKTLANSSDEEATDK